MLEKFKNMGKALKEAQNMKGMMEQVQKELEASVIPISELDGKTILDTGGGILNMMNNSHDNDYLIFNPDTLWNENYMREINEMQNFYFLNKLNNILLIVNKQLSFDENFKGDFELKNNSLKKNNKKNHIYIGCQILNRSIFKKYKMEKFSISKIWDELEKMNKLNGFESLNKFYHLTNLETFKRLRDF